MFRERDRQKCEALMAKYYRGRKFHDTLYREMIARHFRPGQRVLDAGCGRAMKFCKEFTNAAVVVGVDLEEALDTRNTASPFGVKGDLARLPFDANSFDLVISRSVVEHLENPNLVFSEFNRVLCDGGKAVIITPNKYDYVSILAAVTPYRFHRYLVSRIFKVSEDDVFPTRYRANTIRTLRKSLEASGFEELEMCSINHYPAYLSFSPILFRIGVLYERLTSLESLKALRGTLLCAYQKKSAAPGVAAS